MTDDREVCDGCGEYEQDCVCLVGKLTLERERITSVLGEHPDTDIEFIVGKIAEIRSGARFSANVLAEYGRLRDALTAVLAGDIVVRWHHPGDWLVYSSLGECVGSSKVSAVDAVLSVTPPEAAAAGEAK